MNKKLYQKPEIQIYQLMEHAPLLAGSGGSGSGGGGNGGSLSRRFDSPWEDDEE